MHRVPALWTCWSLAAKTEMAHMQKRCLQNRERTSINLLLRKGGQINRLTNRTGHNFERLILRKQIMGIIIRQTGNIGNSLYILKHKKTPDHVGSTHHTTYQNWFIFSIKSATKCESLQATRHTEREIARSGSPRKIAPPKGLTARAGFWYYPCAPRKPQKSF